MSEMTVDDVMAKLEDAGLSAEEMAEEDIYVVRMGDERVSSFLKEFPDYRERCTQISTAALIGVSAILASGPLKGSVDTRARFRGILERFEGRAERAMSDLLKEFEERVGSVEEERRRMKEVDEARKRQSYYAGHSFEQRVVSFLEDFSGKRLDDVEYTGDTTVVGGKVGDIVYRINDRDGEEPRAKVALELKNRRCTTSGKKRFFLDELEEAMVKRKCGYGIVVASVEKNSKDGMFSEPDFHYLKRISRDKYVVLVDEHVTIPIALESALHLIEQSCTLTAEREEMDVDVDRIQEAIARAMDVTQEFRAMKRGLTDSIKGLEDIRGNVDGLEKKVEAALTEAREEVDRSVEIKGPETTEIQGE